MFQGGNWVRANGVDHLIPCFERRTVNYAQSGYFQTRGASPTNWSASVSTPGGWDDDDITDNWQYNLYYHGPPISVSIIGPAEVTSTDYMCNWLAQVSAGSPSYGWTGVLSGSNPVVWGPVASSGWLKVLVTAGAVEARDSVFVTVHGEAPECEA